MNDSHQHKPISTFDEICHLTIETMCSMDMEELLRLKKQAESELFRAKITKGQVDLALSLKQQERERVQREADANQPSMLD
ncbi:MAG: hypothetical protein MK052_11690 [Alphaproteobacteria bacterium]|nr:hypothetical protein [Alphaproteobacteria bacterium]